MGGQTIRQGSLPSQWREVSLLAGCMQNHRPLWKSRILPHPATQEMEEAAGHSQGKEDPARTHSTPQPQPSGKALALSSSLDTGAARGAQQASS